MPRKTVLWVKLGKGAFTAGVVDALFHVQVRR
jgi:hypothetical protein